MGPLSPLHETRRDELLAVAAVVLTRVGFERMRLRDVAAEAGVSIGLLQHYFATREQLGREAFAAVCGERAGRFAGAADDTGPAWDRVAAMLGHAFDDPELEARSRTWLDLCAAAGRDPELRRQAALVQDAWRAPMVRAIEAGIAAGDLRPVGEVRHVVEALVALIDGAEVAVVTGLGIDDRGRLRATTLTVARHLLGVDPDRGS